MPENLTEEETRLLICRAKEVYERGVLAGRSTDEIQAEICRVAPMLHQLEARRVALGWSRRRVLEAAAIILDDDKELLSLRGSDLYDYVRKGQAPGREYVDLLCRVFRCRAADIGYPESSADYRDMETQNQEVQTEIGKAHDEAPPAGRAVHDILVLDQLGMLVTSDPVAELDHALADAAARLRAAQARRDTPAAQRLAAWIDQRLDERASFQDDTETTRGDGEAPRRS